jgi:hypothetical protein
MKVYELLEKKLDGMNIRDYENFAAGLGTQFALVIRASGIKDIKSIDKDELMSALMDQKIVQMDKGGREYCIVSDVKAIRERLLRKVD